MSSLKARLHKLEKSRAVECGPRSLAVVCKDESGDYRTMDGEPIASEEVAGLEACIVVDFVEVRTTRT